MSENCELRRGLRRREKNANDEGAGHFEKPAPDARAAPPEAYESHISRETVAEVPLTGLFVQPRPTPSPWSYGTSNIPTPENVPAGPINEHLSNAGLKSARSLGRPSVGACWSP